MFMKIPVVGKLDGILDEAIGGELEHLWNILTKVFKCHHSMINIVYQTEMTSNVTL